MTPKDDNQPMAEAPATDDTATTENLPPFVPARDRRKYTRFLAPGMPGPGLQLFESPEHEALGDGIVFHDAQGNAFTQSPPNTNYFQTTGGQLLSFGQIMALAGDFYGVPTAPISDGATPAEQQQRFRNAYATLDTETPVGGKYEAQQLLTVIQQQSEAVGTTAQLILTAWPGTQDAWSQAYSLTNGEHQYDIQYNMITGALRTVPWYLSKGRYLQLAAVNWDHFGASAIAAYSAGHACAIDQAAAGNIMQAYATEAFACHFLTDLFSSGHLRTPRKALHTGNPASDPCSQLMHDEDCYNGLVVQDSGGNPWTAWGDKRLNDPVNQANYARARAAVQASVDEISAVIATGKTSVAYTALTMIPNLSIVQNAINPANWSPLYVLGGGGSPRVRDNLSDLRCRVWTSNFAYLSTYWRVPAGGVHSPTGRPPNQGDGAAHQIVWQKHRITGSGEADLAPAAAMVTQFTPPAGLNGQPPGQVGNGTTLPGGQPVPPGELDPAQKNTLWTVFRKTSSDSSNHHVHWLAIPMTDAPTFKTYTPGEIPTANHPQLVTDGGDPALVALTGQVLMVYPDSHGTLWQIYSNSNATTWTTSTGGVPQTALSSSDSTKYQLLSPPGGDASPRAALCNVDGLGLALAYPARSIPGSAGNIAFALANLQGGFQTPSGVQYANASNAQVAPKTMMSVSLVEFDTSLILAYADAGNGNAISLLQTTDGKSWTLLTAAVKGANQTPVTTHSVLSLVPYGGLLMLVVNDSSLNLNTYAWNPNTKQWQQYLIQTTTGSNGGRVPVQTKYALGVTGFQGDAYVVFIDKANGSPSILTTASVPTAS